MKNFAISFRGGLARGFASVGAMGALQDSEIYPHIYAGSSSGSVIASAFALNLNWRDVLDTLEQYRFSKAFSLKSLFVEKSIVSSKKLKENYLENFKDFVSLNTKIEELESKLVIFTSDKTAEKRVAFTEGNLLDVINASCSYPPVFPSVKINSKNFRDGDVVKEFSVNYLANQSADFVVGVTHTDDEIFHDKPTILVEYFADDISHIGFKNIRKVADRAYEEMQQKIPEIEKLMNDSG